MVILTIEETIEEIKDLPLKTLVYDTIDELEEAITALLAREQPVIAYYPNAWQRLPQLTEKITRKGANQYLYTPVDPLETRLAGKTGLTPVSLLIAKNTLASYNMSHKAQFKVEPMKAVDRRSLLRRPLQSIMIYKPAPILLNEETCASWKYCKNCIETCPYNALIGKPPTINPDTCTGCGLCTGACPFGLLMPPRTNIEAFERYLDSIRERIKPDEPAYIIIACRTSLPQLAQELESRNLEELNPAFIVDVDCPGWNTQFHTLAAAGKGFHTLIYCSKETLEECGARDQIEKQLRELKGLPLHSEIITTPEKLIGELKEKPKAKNILGGELLTRNRQLAYKILEAYGIEEAEYSTPIVGYPIVDEEKCILCQACSSMCPFQALKLEETPGGETRLVFYPEKCTACHVCEVACAYDALQLKYLYKREARPYTVLARDEIARCRRCGKPIGSKKHILTLEKQLRESGVDEWVIEQLWLCQECKVKALLEKRIREKTQ